MKRIPNYCAAVVVVHGKSELLLMEYIKSNLHLPIEIYSENNGKSSIQINSIMNVLNNNIFKNKTSFKRKYFINENNKVFCNFRVFTLMDLDDASVEKQNKYKSGELFKGHWLSSYIVPIWNNGNLEDVLMEIKVLTNKPNYKDKGMVYRKIFPINTGRSDILLVEELMNLLRMSNNTNMEVLLKYLLNLVK